MSAQRYSIVEPHPSVSASSYLHTGRGGAGNVTKAPSSVTRGSDASGPAARTSLSSLSSSLRPFTSGRGGAGNIHTAPSERAMFSFDEELERQLSQERHIAPVYHVGRGGAGNIRPAESKTSNNSRVYIDGSIRRSSDNSSTKSTSSAESGADIATRNLKKGWKKLSSVGYYMQG